MNDRIQPDSPPKDTALGHGRLFLPLADTIRAISLTTLMQLLRKIHHDILPLMPKIILLGRIRR
jgi:hypothetical protein